MRFAAVESQLASQLSGYNCDATAIRPPRDFLATPSWGWHCGTASAPVAYGLGIARSRARISAAATVHRGLTLTQPSIPPGSVNGYGGNGSLTLCGRGPVHRSTKFADASQTVVLLPPMGYGIHQGDEPPLYSNSNTSTFTLFSITGANSLYFIFKR